MLTAVTYNCDPESLGEVDQVDFVEAFENEVRVKSLYRDLSIRVTFTPGYASGLTAVASDDWESDLAFDAQFDAEFSQFAKRAFAACRS